MAKRCTSVAKPAVSRDLSEIGLDDASLATADAHDLSMIRQPPEEMVTATIDITERKAIDPSHNWETRLFGCGVLPRGTVSGPVTAT